MNSKIIECFVMVGGFFLCCGVILVLYQIPVYFGINNEFLRAGFVFFAPFVIIIYPALILNFRFMHISPLLCDR